MMSTNLTKVVSLFVMFIYCHYCIIGRKFLFFLKHFISPKFHIYFKLFYVPAPAVTHLCWLHLHLGGRQTCPVKYFNLLKSVRYVREMDKTPQKGFSQMEKNDIKGFITHAQNQIFAVPLVFHICQFSLRYPLIVLSFIVTWKPLRTLALPTLDKCERPRFAQGMRRLWVIANQWRLCKVSGRRPRLPPC